MMNFKVKPPYSLKYTLECGQAFRWEKANSFFFGIVSQTVFRIYQKDDTLGVESSRNVKSAEHIKDYLDTESDINDLLKEIDVDENIHTAISKFRGLRVLNQAPWECMISFIISAYNNIPRIKRLISNLSAYYGKRVFLNGYTNFSFPEAVKLAYAKLRDLRAMGLGYRAEYVLDTSRQFLKEEDNFFSLGDKSYEEARDFLLKFPGIGEKVADCVLLFSFKKYEAFPVDVRIKRIVEDLYFKGRNTSPKKIREFAKSHFGRFCGYAQQYLYHYEAHRRKNKHIQEAVDA